MRAHGLTLAALLALGCVTRGAAPRPTAARTLAECQACNGEWGPHGISQEESCYCRTDDKGRPCDRPDQCQAYCELDWEAALTASQTRCTASGCSGGPGLSGRCAEFYWRHGCRGFLSEDPQVDGGWLARSLCVD